MTRFTIFAFSLALLGGPMALAGEHPHPSKKAEEAAKKSPEATKASDAAPGESAKPAKGEKPAKPLKDEKTDGKKDKTSWNPNQVEKELIAFVNRESAESDGRFKVRDDLLDQTREMKLKKIHKEKIMQMEDGTSFVCADFTDANGEKVDVDFFMQPTAQGTVDEVTKVQIHKVNGKQRFTYVLQDGKWLQKDVSLN